MLVSIQPRRQLLRGDSAQAQADRIIDPEVIVTPGIYVDRAVLVENPLEEETLLLAGEERRPQ